MRAAGGLGSGSAVGIKLFNEVADYAPASLTWRERYVLALLAENANDGTREGWHGYEGDSERSVRFRARVRCSRSQFYETIKSLVAKGAIKVTVRGQKGQQAHYVIMPMAPVALRVPETGTLNPAPQGPGLQDPEGSGPEVQGPESKDPEHAFRVPEARTLNGIQGPGLQDPERSGPEVQGPGLPVSGSRFTGFRVPVYGTPSPQSPQSQNLSLPIQLIRSARVVAPDEERDLVEWIMKTRRPGSGQWWRTVAERGDLPALADAWRAARPAPSPHAPFAEVRAGAEGDAPRNPVPAGYDDKGAYRRALKHLAAIDPERARALLADACQRLVDQGYHATVTAQYILAAELFDADNEHHPSPTESEV
jgi:hypothetical protein